jgi:metal-responsive CopG/Arc/MetJ family transcriptional regulator
MGRSVKTTITIDEDLWKKFSIAVIGERGLRKKNDVISRLVKEYVERKESEGKANV